ncbi:MAG TPA: hypothetical protein DEA08_09700 [Planctomycetes bacterium]|nr:hypothetical protein [Planctomycetota bacterium]
MHGPGILHALDLPDSLSDEERLRALQVALNRCLTNQMCEVVGDRVYEIAYLDFADWYEGPSEVEYPWRELRGARADAVRAVYDRCGGSSPASHLWFLETFHLLCPESTDFSPRRVRLPLPQGGFQDACAWRIESATTALEDLGPRVEGCDDPDLDLEAIRALHRRLGEELRACASVGLGYAFELR